MSWRLNKDGAVLHCGGEERSRRLADTHSHTLTPPEKRERERTPSQLRGWEGKRHLIQLEFRLVSVFIVGSG